MSSIVVIGSQWGDEGKGKIVDFLAQRADVVVRYSGGSNAGHTVVVNDVAYKLRLLPSGILYKDKTCILGNGVVINPRVVLEEIRGMQAKGVDTTNLLISDRAHVVFPYHEKQDELQELALGANKIGTTKGGIGPCYMDKYARTGIRVCDLMNKEVLAEKLKRTLSAKNKLFTEYYKAEPLAYEPMLKAYLEYAEALRPHVCDTSVALGDFFDEGRKVLFEGAQATFLDIDYGTFPYVTSSNPTAGNAATGSGVGPRFIDHVVGVVKAYTTRVADLSILAKAKPVYETFKGWKCDISSVRSYEDLPQEAQTYLNRLSEVVGVEIGIVSVGPNRDQTFTLKSFFED